MRQVTRSALLFLLFACVLTLSAWAKGGKETVLQYVDGGPGEMIQFELPKKGKGVSGICIHGSRHGMPAKEVTFCGDGMIEVLLAK